MLKISVGTNLYEQARKLGDSGATGSKQSGGMKKHDKAKRGWVHAAPQRMTKLMGE
jgi:hypothetical protein